MNDKFFKSSKEESPFKKPEPEKNYIKKKKGKDRIIKSNEALNEDCQGHGKMKFGGTCDCYRGYMGHDCGECDHGFVKNQYNQCETPSAQGTVGKGLQSSTGSGCPPCQNGFCEKQKCSCFEGYKGRLCDEKIHGENDDDEDNSKPGKKVKKTKKDKSKKTTDSSASEDSGYLTQ
jgi:hypothetical protein